MEVDPYKPPGAPLGDPASVPSGVDLRALVFSYRSLVRWVGVQLLLAIGGAVVVGGLSGQAAIAVAWARLLGVLATSVVLILYAYRTAKALGSSAPIIWAAAMVVPLLNLITLLVLSSRATKTCKAAGVPVGFFGPKEVPSSGKAAG